MEDNCTVIKNEVTESPDLCNLEDIEEIFITSPKLEAEDHDDEYVRNYTTDLEGLSCNTEGSEQDIKPTLPEIEHFMAVTENSESHINNMFSNISNINGMTSVFSTNEAVASSGSSHDKKKAPSEGVCPFICDICGKYFSWKNSLKRHKKMHSDIRSYTCDICGKNYKTYPILVQHKRIHTGVRLYTCDICGKNFYQKTNLTSHKKIHADVFPFTCDICGKKFTYVGSLRSHKKLHIGVRPFTCDICGKNFIRKTHLTEHINVHTGVRPYVCDICGKSFKQIGGLTIHKKTHTGFKRFCCCEYDKIFGYKSSLEYHIRTVHLLDCTNRPSVQNTCQKKHNKETEDNHTKFEDNLQENPTVKQELNFPEFADNDFKRFCCCECDKKCGYKNGLEYHIRAAYLLHFTNRPSVQNTCQKKHNKETEDIHTKFEGNVPENLTVKQEINLLEFVEKSNIKDEYLTIKNEVIESPDLCNLEDIQEKCVTSPKQMVENHDEDLRKHMKQLEGYMSGETQGSTLEIVESSKSYIKNEPSI